MAKAPLLGVGKTRLAAEIGDHKAWRVNRRLHAHTLNVARDPRWQTLLCVTPDEAVALQLPGVWPDDVQRIPQGEGDLGERLARALSLHRNVAVIGTDCPDISAQHIASAFDALEHKPFALGPAQDGGFWLLAVREGEAAARAMAPVRWSSEHTATDVLRNLAAENVTMLETLRDVDVAADLKRD
jgi:rSAM/selenodomain-associated transferase 1